MKNVWANPTWDRLFQLTSTQHPEEETEELSRQFFREWVLSHRGRERVQDWVSTIKSQTNPERRRIWTEVLEGMIAEGVVEGPPPPPIEPAEMLEWDEVPQ